MLNKNDCRRILIIRLSAIGDVVLTTPVAKALRRAFPDAYIAWVVETKSRDAVEGNPYLDEVIVWDRKSGSGSLPMKAIKYIRNLRALGKELRAGKFDVAIDFQGLLRSAVVGRISGARMLVGYDNAREGAHRLYKVCLPVRKLARGVDLYREMLGLLDVPTDEMEMHFPISDADRTFAGEFIADALASRPSARKIVALCPATTWPQKHWTEEGWAGLADALTADYGVLPIFLGSPDDTGLMDRIHGLMKSDPVSAIGRTTLKQAAAIISRSDLVISVDTGLLHIANALDLPIVGIFGPTTWDYLGKKDSLAIVAKELKCMPCFKHPSCESFDCMRAITPDDVLSAAERWLTKQITTV